MAALDTVAVAVLNAVSPSGALADVAVSAQIDHDQAAFDVAKRAYDLAQEPTLSARLEDDFAACVPALADAAVPLESWAIPLLSALAGPCAPVLSLGLTVACKVALAALTSWAQKRAVKPKGA